MSSRCRKFFARQSFDELYLLLPGWLRLLLSGAAFIFILLAIYGLLVSTLILTGSRWP